MAHLTVNTWVTVNTRVVKTARIKRLAYRCIRIVCANDVNDVSAGLVRGVRNRFNEMDRADALMSPICPKHSLVLG